MRLQRAAQCQRKRHGGEEGDGKDAGNDGALADTNQPPVDSGSDTGPVVRQCGDAGGAPLRVLVTIGGSTADLDRLSGSALVLDLEVAGLRPGQHEVAVTASLPTGTTLVAVSPAKVTVSVSVAPVSPSAPASAGPSGGG